MDIRRTPTGKRTRNLRLAVAGFALLVITFALARLAPPAPSVDRDTLLLGTVERGELICEVRGSGTLVPERGNAGTTLARVAGPEQLKAELHIPWSRVQDVKAGQPVVVRARTDTITGRVRQIDPHVRRGLVLVEVALEEDLPASARPDLNVNGVIRVERLESVVHVRRPAYGLTRSAASVFRLSEDGRTAERVRVRFGRSSVHRMEILEGLAPGDVIVLSDMRRFDDVDRIRIR